MAQRITWEERLRQQVKAEHGFGWSLTAQSGKTKITRRYEDNSRSSVLVPLEYAPRNERLVSEAVAELVKLMRERSLGLSEARKLLSFDEQEESSNGVNWLEVSKAFLESRSDRRATTLRDLKYRIDNALQTIDSKPKPRDGKSLIKAYAKQHFDNCPPGGQGRKRHLGDVSAFLRFAVERASAPIRWLPLEGEELEELIGTSDNGSGEDITPPVKPEQLAALLDSLNAMGKSELWLAVGLVGLFGLRPSELMALRVEDGKLYVGGQVKRNRQTMKKTKPDRLVLPLDIPGREGEGQRVLDLYVHGPVTLPTSIRNAKSYKACGDYFRQYLERSAPWRALVKATPGLTPYSLRHGFAWRGHKSYDRSISVRDLAALMGHNPSTHFRHYGKWTDEEGLLDAVALATGQNHH